MRSHIACPQTVPFTLSKPGATTVLRKAGYAVSPAKLLCVSILAKVVRLVARLRVAWPREFLQLLYVYLTYGVATTLIIRRWKTGMPQLVIKSGSRTGQTIELFSGTIRLGRHPANDQCFNDVTLSSHHCEIIVGNGIVQVRDLGSTNGTFIDSQSVKEAALMPGQMLHLGAVDLAFEEVPFEISIPALPVLQPSLLLPDGTPACANHSDSHATMDCMECHKAFCELCVHQIRRVGGAALKLCPSCGGHCHAIAQEKAGNKRKSRLGSWLGKLMPRMNGRLMRANP